MADDKRTDGMTVTEAESAPPENIATLRDRRIRPEGVVPKQAQGYVVAGLAVLILMAVMFSKNHAKSQKEIPPPTPAASNDINQRKIQELEQDLSADQRRGEQHTQRTGGTGSPATASPAIAAQPGNTVAVSQAPAATEPPHDPVADAEKALAFKARFASNLVTADDAASRPSAPQTDYANPNGSAETTQQTSGSPTTPATAQKRAPEVNVNSAHGRPHVLFEGTTIDTALVTRLDGEFAGPVKVMVTNPVYSTDRQHVLIPEGTFILGDTQKVSSFGQKRLAVVFHRMLMPDNYSVDLDQFRGLDQAGETGLKDKVNNHYLQIFGASIALGVIAAAAEATTNSGYNQSGSDLYRQGMAETLASSGANVLDRFINIAPTITIREGHRIKIYLTQDLLLPAYGNHDMAGVM